MPARDGTHLDTSHLLNLCGAEMPAELAITVSKWQQV